MAAALCAWDGGRLPRSTELQAAWRGNDNRAYPWGNTLDPSRMVHKYLVQALVCCHQAADA